MKFHYIYLSLVKFTELFATFYNFFLSKNFDITYALSLVQRRQHLPEVSSEPAPWLVAPPPPSHFLIVVPADLNMVFDILSILSGYCGYGKYKQFLDSNNTPRMIKDDFLVNGKSPQ